MLLVGSIILPASTLTVLWWWWAWLPRKQEALGSIPAVARSSPVILIDFVIAISIGNSIDQKWPGSYVKEVSLQTCLFKPNSTQYLRYRRWAIGTIYPNWSNSNIVFDNGQKKISPQSKPNSMMKNFDGVTFGCYWLFVNFYNSGSICWFGKEMQ